MEQGLGLGLLGLREGAPGFPSPLGDLSPPPPCSLTVNNWLATVTLGQAGMHATYYHKASDQVRARDRPCGRTARLRGQGLVCPGV